MATARTKKSRPAKKAAEDTVASKRAAVKEANVSLGQDIMKMRDDQGMKFQEIADDLRITPGKVHFLYACATVKPKDRIKWSDDDDLAAKIVDARDDDELSWGLISARAGVPESRVRKLYTDTTGKSTLGMSIGKGGRKPTNGAKPASKTAKAAKGRVSTAKGKAKPPAAEPAAAKSKVARRVRRRTS